MNPPEEADFQTRRSQLASEIARQRGELVSAYLRLEKPIHYTEYGMRGFGFIRQNPWVFTAAPAVFSLLFSVLGWKKKKKPAPVQSQMRSPEMARPTTTTKLSRLGQAAMTGVEQGLRVYNLYRRVRSLIP